MYHVLYQVVILKKEDHGIGNIGWSRIQLTSSNEIFGTNWHDREADPELPQTLR